MELGAGVWWATGGVLVLYGLWRNEVRLAEPLSVSAAVQYFNFPGEEPFVSELAAKLGLGPATLRLGRFPVTWDEGLVHHDLWTGTDGALLSFKDWELGALRPGGRWLGVLRWRGFGLSAGEFAWAWAGLERAPLKARLALCSRREWAGLLEVRKGPFGAGYAVMSRNWENLAGFPIIYNNFYNGWTGLGDAFTWAVMKEPGVARLVSSVEGGEVGVFWPDMRNLQALNLNARLGPARADLWGFWLYDAEPLGYEASLNLIVTKGPALGGLGAGQFFSANEKAPSAGVLRAWLQVNWRLLGE